MQVKLISHNFFSKLVSLLVFILILSSPFSTTAYSATNKRQELNSINQKINKNKQKISENNRARLQLESDIKKADIKMRDIQTRLDELQSSLNDTKAQMSATQAQLDKLKVELDQKQKELEEAEKELNRLTQILNTRAQNFYKGGDVSYLEVLLTAKSFSELLHRADYLSRIVNQDAQLVRQIKETKAAIEEAKAAIENNKIATEQKQAALVTEERRLASLATDQLGQKDSLTNELNSKKSLFANVASQNSQLAAELEIEESEASRLSAQINNSPGGGSFIPIGSPSASGYVWPTSGPIYPGGYWGDPRDGGSRRHAGIDLAIGTGTSIVAVKSGVVSGTDYDAMGYGYYVDVAHGGGVVTRYAHLSRWVVSVGQAVGQGERIAVSGASGSGSGPHLHFEIRTDGGGFGINGTVNPLKYLP